MPRLFSVALLLLSSAGQATAQPAVTFSRDVAPLVYEHCVACHRPNAIGRFSLLSYEEARPWARAIREQVVTRQMPPWPPEPGHGEFQGERGLSDDEIAILSRWVEAGAPEGDPADMPQPPALEDGWQLGQPDLVITLDAPYTLQPGTDDVFRNFVIPIPVTETRHVQTIEFRPGGSGAVHHTILGVDDTRSSRRRDAEDDEPGFEGMDMGQAAMPDGHILGWTPGMFPSPGIEGAPWRLVPGTDMVVQLHLLPFDDPVEIQPSIGFFFADGPATGPPMYLVRLDGDHELDIPPGEREFVVTDSIDMPVDVTVYAVYPHAHLIGKAVEGWATLPDGSREPLIKIDQWDFAWQDVYRLKEPLTLPGGSTLHMRFSYDNSEANPANPYSPPRRIRAGNRSFDEMAHLQLQVQPRAVEDLPRLEEAAYRRAIERNPTNPWSHYSLGNALRDSGQLDDAVSAYQRALALDPEHTPTHINLGMVFDERGMSEPAISHFRDAIRLDPASADGYYNLGTSLTLQGRPEEAIPHLREAVALEPGLAPAHTNLGQALMASGQPGEAIDPLERAVAIDPDSAEAHNNLGAALGMVGRFQEAVSHFQRALAIDPAHQRARENLELAQDILSEPPGE